MARRIGNGWGSKVLECRSLYVATLDDFWLGGLTSWSGLPMMALGLKHYLHAIIHHSGDRTNRWGIYRARARGCGRRPVTWSSHELALFRFDYGVIFGLGEFNYGTPLYPRRG
ncbi:hypothetical protein EVAR_43770_1 [Eumeta japonica]|uniref:Uncharacterized protein n=1 Tax=Eumeta variegata TaxID=151549 RepID=A0A4C1XJ52_EUMVA|nr:hypothetical protein EVAR_43770_1 [Eumeta japonica]